MFKKISALILFFIGSLVFPISADAIAKFSTSYQIYYSVSENGKTHVKFIINQKNNLSVVYATDFGLSINETKLENLRVLDENVLVVADVVKSLNQTSISFPFANKVVGKDKVHTFTIEYDTTDISTKYGNTWQIDIPRLEPDENVSEQTVILSVPSGFSTPAYIDPKPDVVSGNVYYFSGGKLSNKSISAIFGKTQYYQGKIVYHLANNEKVKINTEIALPPDTSYQTVYYQNIEPKPQSVYKDADGNWLAKYGLSPGEKVDVIADLLVKLDLQPKPTNSQPSDSLTAKSPIWNYDNSVFNTPEIRNLKTPKSIYEYVVDKLKYDYDKLSRQRPLRAPAAESLINNQSAICTDFTDIFVAIARKAGIYAREIEGYAMSDNPDLKPLSLTQDILHAWPEYYDKNKSTWIQIDPTWANTTRGIDYFNKLDFNHITFVIHGENPEYPVPAGGYKNGTKSKDISFEPTENVEFPAPVFTLQYVKQDGQDLIIDIKNTSGVAYSGNVTSDDDPNLEKYSGWVNIPPFSSQIIRLRAKKQPFIRKINSQAIIYLNGSRYQAGYSLSSGTYQALVFTGVGGFLALTALGSWHLHLRRRKQKTSLYR